MFVQLWAKNEPKPSIWVEVISKSAIFELKLREGLLIKVIGGGPRVNSGYFLVRSYIVANLMYFQMQLREFPEMTSFRRKMTFCVAW